MASFFPGNIDPTLTRDQGNTPYDSRGQWQFGTANPGSNTHGGYSPDLSEVISNASAKALEVNGHFIRVKMIADQRATEIEKLQETLASKTKENDQLTKENDHLNVEVKTLKEALGLFAKDYHNRQGGASGGFLNITPEIMDLPPKQALRIRTDNTGVVYWLRKEYRRAARKQNRGETDGNATSVQAKRKPGRPPRDSEDEEDHSAHFYLENQDGTPVDKSVIAEMSRKARMLWRTLDKNGLAPETFGKISAKVWDYFSRTILADKAHEFLLLFKTEKDSTDSVKDSDPSADKDEDENDLRKQALEDPKLIRMKSHDSSQDEDHDRDDPDAEEHHSEDSNDDPSEHAKNDDDPDSDAENDDPDARDSEQHTENGNKTTGSEAGGPTTGGTQGTPTPPMGPSTGTRTSTTSALVDPFAPTPSTSPIPSVGTSNTVKSANNTTPATTTGFRLKLKMGAPKKPSSDAVDNDTPILAPATHGTTTSNGTDPGCVGHNTGPPPDTPPNLHVPAKICKKRKPASEGSNTSSTTNKRQKVSNVLAIPTEGNTIRNICMRHWNEEQPGGQGPLSEFDVYFKSLTDAGKEPFKKEQRNAQATASTLLPGWQHHWRRSSNSSGDSTAAGTGAGVAALAWVKAVLENAPNSISSEKFEARVKELAEKERRMCKTRELKLRVLGFGLPTPRMGTRGSSVRSPPAPNTSLDTTAYF
ncbi:hypothetical protein EDB84DRAFT_1565692 [Lactarius hengduanensis]|nr:hypothetical protein EDB84DRAFT_1565692 [Lactarius hengduanensis]